MNYNKTQILRKKEELTSKRGKRKKRIRVELLSLYIFCVLAMVAVAGFSVAGALRGIFTSAPVVGEQEILSDGEASVFYDMSGKEIQKANGRQAKKEYVTGSQISDAVKKAFLASQDPRFYEHQGMDIRNLVSDVYSTLRQKENSKENSRTLSQKLLKNQIYSNDNADSLLEQMSGKIQEQYQAVKMEEKLGKEKILEYYLNTVCLGENIIGIQKASHYFFEKDASSLTISEAAVLAAAGINSIKYHPLKHQADNASQRELVLESMLKYGFISEDEYEDALGDDVYIRLQNTREREKGFSEGESFYIDAVISSVIEDLKTELGYTQTRAYNAVYHGGLKIYTCQDQQIQKICDNTIRKEMGDSKAELSFVVMEQETGKVKALNGDIRNDYVKLDENGATDFLGSPGNVFSLLSTWLPGIDTMGMTLAQVFDDSECLLEQNGVYQVVSSAGEYSGLVTLRKSILESLQVPQVRAMDQIGVQTGYDYLKNLRFTTLVERRETLEGEVESDVSLEMARGHLVDGVNNLELTSAYAAIANGGRYLKPVFYTKVVDKEGNVLLKNAVHEKRILKSSTTWLISDVLEQYVQEKGLSLDGMNMSVAGISGEAYSEKEYWFEGYSSYYTAGCRYVPESSAESEKHQIIWKNIMQKIHEKTGVKPVKFKMPSDIVEEDICTKCGNLAVEGLCDEAQGGSCIETEYFVRGTQPKENCNCHIKYTLCKTSGKLAKDNCPREDVQEKVFLMKKETGDTKDTPYVLPEDLPGLICDKH